MYSENHNYSSLTPIDFLKKNAYYYPNDIAFFLIDGSKLTYKEVYDRIKSLGYFFMKKNIQKGDKVAILSENSLEVIELHYAIAIVGAIVVSINPNLSINEINKQIKYSESKFIYTNMSNEIIKSIKSENLKLHFLVNKYISDSEYVYNNCTKLRNIEFNFPQIDETEPLAINFTSGTTGMPKGVVYSHRVAYLQALGQINIFNLEKTSRYLWSLPMFHGNGWAHIWALFASTTTQVFISAEDLKNKSKALEIIDNYKITHLAGSPRLLSNLLLHEENNIFLKSLNVMIGGASPSYNLLKKFYELEINLVNQYGLNESLGSITATNINSNIFNSLDDYIKCHSKQGFVSPHFGSGFKVVDEKNNQVLHDGKTIGEIKIKGNTLFSFYLKNNEITKKSINYNWFSTGDLAVIHKDGSIELKDRKKNLIYIEDGEDWLNVSSLEIEDTLLQFEKIKDVAVIGIPKKNSEGMIIIAFIETDYNFSSFKNELDQYTDKNLGRLKTPYKFIVTNLPKTATGKVQKHILYKHEHINI